MTVAQNGANKMLKRRWYSGSRDATLEFETPLTRNEVARRLRAFRGIEILGGQRHRDWKVVAGNNGRGFYVFMRGDFLLPMTVSCRWLPTTSGTRFKAMIVPALSRRTFLVRIVVVVSVIIGFGLLLNQLGASSLVEWLVVISVACLLPGFVLPKNHLDHDLAQFEVASRFLRETLDAEEIDAEYFGEPFPL